MRNQNLSRGSKSNWGGKLTKYLIEHQATKKFLEKYSDPRHPECFRLVPTEKKKNLVESVLAMWFLISFRKLF